MLEIARKMSEKLLDPKSGQSWQGFVGLVEGKFSEWSLKRMLEGTFGHDSVDSVPVGISRAVRKYILFCLLAPDKKWSVDLFGLDLGSQDGLPTKSEFIKDLKGHDQVFIGDTAEILREFSFIIRESMNTWS